MVEKLQILMYKNCRLYTYGGSCVCVCVCLSAYNSETGRAIASKFLG